MNKICLKCSQIFYGQVAIEKNFYKERRNEDGLMRCCKVCEKEYRKKTKGKVKKVKRKYNKKYYEKNKKRIRERIKVWRLNNGHKKRAQEAVAKAIKKGVLVPEPCSVKGCRVKKKVDAHHWSYKEEHWLDVVWLCKSHHQTEHFRLKMEVC